MDRNCSNDTSALPWWGPAEEKENMLSCYGNQRPGYGWGIVDETTHTAPIF